MHGEGEPAPEVPEKDIRPVMNKRGGGPSLIVETQVFFRRVQEGMTVFANGSCWEFAPGCAQAGYKIIQMD